MKDKFKKNNERARIASSFFRLRGEIKIERMSESIFIHLFFTIFSLR